MKKILLVGAFVISAVSFANSNNSQGLMHGIMNKGMMMNGGGVANCKMMNGSVGKGMMGMNMTPELRKEMQNDMIKMQEKQLEINKIMNTSNPDMKKVEKLNNEIYQIKANHMTKMQQNMMKTN